MKVKEHDAAILEYLAVLVSILGMGSLYFQVLRMSVMAMMLLFVMVLFWIRHPFLRADNLCIYLSFTFLFFLSSVINRKNGVRTNDLIIWCIHFLFLITLQTNMTYESFKKKYVIWMTIEAAISILCFLWGDFLGNPLPFLRHQYGSANSYYLTPYFTLGWGNVPVFHRNAGIFSEPGMHQIFLNFALLMLLSDNTRLDLSILRFRFCAFLLISAVLTTFSTTGYLCLGVVFSAVLLKKGPQTKYRKMKLFMFAALCILFLIEMKTGVIRGKLEGIYTGRGSGRTRLNDTISGFKIALSRPLLGHGIFMSNYTSYLDPYGIQNISNGFVYLMIKAGIPFSILFLIFIYLGIKKQYPYGRAFVLCFFLLYFLSINTEGGIFNLLYLSFIGNWKPNGTFLHQADGILRISKISSQLSLYRKESP